MCRTVCIGQRVQSFPASHSVTSSTQAFVDEHIHHFTKEVLELLPGAGSLNNKLSSSVPSLRTPGPTSCPRATTAVMASVTHCKSSKNKTSRICEAHELPLQATAVEQSGEFFSYLMQDIRFCLQSMHSSPRVLLCTAWMCFWKDRLVNAMSPKIIKQNDF